VIKKIGPQWEEAGTLLGIDSAELEIINVKKRGNPEDCCRSVMEKWFNSGGSGHYKLNWDGMLELLEDLALSATAEKLGKILSSSS